VFRSAGRTEEESKILAEGYFSLEKAGELARMETTLRRLTPTEFADLYRHGFEVADVTLNAYDTTGLFKLLRYVPDQHRLLDA
jgi:hypothetical protein